MCVVTTGGVVFWFRPIAEADVGGRPAVPPAVGLLIYSALSVMLFVWIVRRLGRPFAAAFAIGAAQYILVLDLSLRGERGLATAAASAVLIGASWASVALVYSLVGGERRR
jgi:hypothetical protein